MSIGRRPSRPAGTLDTMEMTDGGHTATRRPYQLDNEAAIAVGRHVTTVTRALSASNYGMARADRMAAHGSYWTVY